MDLDSINDPEDLHIDEMTDAEVAAWAKVLQEREDEEIEKYGEDNLSMFGGLCLDYELPKTSEASTSSEDLNEFASPIRPKRHRSRQRDYEIENELLDLNPDELYETLRDYDPVSIYEIDKATNVLAKVYDTMDRLDEMFLEDIERPEVPSIQNFVDDEEFPAHFRPLSTRNTEERSVGNSAPSAKRSVTISLPATSKATTEPKKPAVDPTLRPILFPAPGQTSHRHDPVTLYHMYKEEWKRMPTPDEQKRLELRWKVRDFLIRKQFVPNKMPTGEPLQHPKDWSPKPYLD